jgi:hypothetical protein
LSIGQRKASRRDAHLDGADEPLEKSWLGKTEQGR